MMVYRAIFGLVFLAFCCLLYALGFLNAQPDASQFWKGAVTGFLILTAASLVAMAWVNKNAREPEPQKLRITIYERSGDYKASTPVDDGTHFEVGRTPSEALVSQARALHPDSSPELGLGDIFRWLDERAVITYVPIKKGV